MTVRLALRRLLPLLAVLSLALTSMVAPAATAGMHASMAPQLSSTGHDAQTHGTAMDHAGMAAMDMADMTMDDQTTDDQTTDDMPCCPKEKAAKPDCAKGCPLMALCLASVASLLPNALPLPAPVGMRARLAWPASASFASVHGTPLPEPPRA